ncbi:MAG: hypothetical protein IT578_10925 [Verrucomicrobiae bacterium]|nr:hypothetical protein [Verrucomicrobiae bacterium]
MNLAAPRVGLLPLYAKLYDDFLPERRAECETVLREASEGLARRGAEVEASGVVRTAAEAGAAIRRFETARVDALVTLHLAYSPSLESAPALTRSALPLVLLDTSPDAAFGTNADPARIMANHGVHGVMDLASVLRRRGRAFEVVAGHLRESRALDRVIELARAGRAARALRGMRVARIGSAFPGMGDFAVTPATLREAFGIEARQAFPAVLAKAMATVSDRAVRAEMALDRERYEVRADEKVHRRAVRVGLALREWIGRQGLGAFSVNFLAFQDPRGPAMPFLEISKALARGTGYAGEGDLLTAALVGALAQGFGGTTFTEVFCADWRGNHLFLSHMGETNPDLAPDRPRVVAKSYPFLKSGPAAAIVAGIRAGPAIYANLVPGSRGTFELIVAPVEMMPDTERDDLREVVRGWMRPAHLPVPRFLEEYSRRGGTHHAALVLGDRAEAVAAFARFAGIPAVTL